MLESKHLLFFLSEIPSLIYFSRCNSFFRLLSFEWSYNLIWDQNPAEFRFSYNDCLWRKSEVILMTACPSLPDARSRFQARERIVRVAFQVSRVQRHFHCLLKNLSLFLSLSFSLLKNWDHEYLSVYLIHWFQKKLRQESCIHHFSSLAGTTIVIFFWRRWSGSVLKERKERRGMKINIMSIALQAAPLLLLLLLLLLHCNSLIVK